MLKGKNEMKSKNKNSSEAKQLSDEEIETVNGGMKIVVEEEEEQSWFKTLMDFIFKIKD